MHLLYDESMQQEQRSVGSIWHGISSPTTKLKRRHISQFGEELDFWHPKRCIESELVFSASIPRLGVRFWKSVSKPLVEYTEMMKVDHLMKRKLKMMHWTKTTHRIWMRRLCLHCSKQLLFYVMSF